MKTNALNSLIFEQVRNVVQCTRWCNQTTVRRLIRAYYPSPLRKKLLNNMRDTENYNLQTWIL